MRKLLLLTICLLLSQFYLQQAFALLKVGGTITSHSSGRAEPGAYGALFFDSFAITGMSFGVRTTSYFHSAYQGSFLFLWSPGSILGGKLTAGFGLGWMYAKRGWRTDANDKTKFVEKEDINGGPAFGAYLDLFGPFFIALEGIYGLRKVHPIFANFQDSAGFIVGIEI